MKTVRHAHATNAMGNSDSADGDHGDGANGGGVDDGFGCFECKGGLVKPTKRSEINGNIQGAAVLNDLDAKGDWRNPLLQQQQRHLDF